MPVCPVDVVTCKYQLLNINDCRKAFNGHSVVLMATAHTLYIFTLATNGIRCVYFHLGLLRALVLSFQLSLRICVKSLSPVLALQVHYLASDLALAWRVSPQYGP